MAPVSYHHYVDFDIILANKMFSGCAGRVLGRGYKKSPFFTKILDFFSKGEWEKKKKIKKWE